jgi:hypothetical protein
MMQVDAAAVVSWVTIIGAIVSLGLWLRGETKQIATDANDRLLHSDDFAERVSRLVSLALTGTIEPVTRALADMELRQRDHGRRLGELEKKLAAVEGRLHGSRTGDLP